VGSIENVTGPLSLAVFADLARELHPILGFVCASLEFLHDVEAQRMDVDEREGREYLRIENVGVPMAEKVLGLEGVDATATICLSAQGETLEWLRFTWVKEPSVHTTVTLKSFVAGVRSSHQLQFPSDVVFEERRIPDIRSLKVAIEDLRFEEE
jgi:hypothetical protein